MCSGSVCESDLYGQEIEFVFRFVQHMLELKLLGRSLHNMSMSLIDAWCVFTV